MLKRYVGAKGTVVELNIEENNNVLIPTMHTLLDNYPNPFNPTTLIEFSVPQATYTTLTVYDVLGREIQTLVNGVIKAGNHTAFFDAGDIPSGVYLYTIQSGTFSETKKMMLLK